MIGNFKIQRRQQKNPFKYDQHCKLDAIRSKSSRIVKRSLSTSPNDDCNIAILTDHFKSFSNQSV